MLSLATTRSPFNDVATSEDIVGIVVASVIVLPLLLLIVYLTYIRVKEKREKEGREKESKEEGEAERMEGGGSEGEREEGGEAKAAVVNEMATKSHPNLVRLMGYCFDISPDTERMEQIVIYEFVDNGDLDRWIGPLVMLTLITARKAIYNADADQINFKQWMAPLLAAGDAAAMRDPQLEAPDDLVLRMARLALRCTAMPTASRPSISRVLGELLVMKEEFLGQDEDRMAARIDRELESSENVSLSMEIARAQWARSSGGLSSNPRA
ncbi:unnamed protein product [Closterium sp. NIES-64]|nr:unnamed protein product [Closterium sp. NIES-64]